MNRLQQKSAICFLLIISILLSSFPVYATQSTSKEGTPSITTSAPVTAVESVSLEQLKQLGEGEKTLAELMNMSVDVKTLPECVDQTLALKKGHVNRLIAQENSLSTVIFQNKDGTRSTYLYAKPVKYIDESGNIRDKSSKISALTDRSFSYGMVENSTQVYFSASSSIGTLVSYQDYAIFMRPKDAFACAPAYNANENKIIYDGVFGEQTSIIYKTTLYGLKEDIVLYQNIEKNKFYFELELENLTPVKTGNTWSLLSEKKETIASFGEIVVRDSAGATTKGEMTIAKGNKDGKVYQLTIAVPNTFLQSSETVYPVYIDPTTYIEEQGMIHYMDEYGGEHFETYDAITDTGLYATETAATEAVSNPNWHKLGEDITTSGKIVYKLYDFFGERGQYKNLRAGQIGYASLLFYASSGAGTTVFANPMSDSWNSFDVGENPGENPLVPNSSTLYEAYSTEIQHSCNLSSNGGLQEIEITDILRGWADFNSSVSTEAYNNPQNGFVLRSNSYTYREIASVENSTYDDVVLVLDTSSFGGTYYVSSLFSGFLLSNTGNILGTTEQTGYFAGWRFDYIGNEKYYITAWADGYALADINGTPTLQALPSSPANNYVWQVYLSEIGGVIIKNAQSQKVLCFDGNSNSLVLASEVSASDNTYKQIVFAIVLQSQYIDLQSFSITVAQEWMDVGTVQTCQIGSLVPFNATWCLPQYFKWSSSDVSVATVDANGNVIGVGNGYATIKAVHRETQKNVRITIVVGQMIPNGAYQVRNMQTDKFMDVGEGALAEGLRIQQWDYRNTDQSKWKFTYEGSGYYYIQPKQTGGENYYVATSRATSGAQILLTTTPSDACKWKITMTDSGRYKITAKISETNNMAVSLPFQGYTASGVYLTQRAYTDDSLYTDEWFIYYDVAMLAYRDENGIPRDAFMDDVQGHINAVAGSKTFLRTFSSEFTKEQMDTILENNKIFIIHTHGNQVSFQIAHDEYYNLSDIMQLDMSGTKLCIFLTCEGGKGLVDGNGVDNLVEAALYSGATTVLAFSKSIFTDHADRWLVEVFRIMRTTGCTLQDAIERLDNHEVSFDEHVHATGFEMSEVAVIGGNGSITLSQIFG